MGVNTFQLRDAYPAYGGWSVGDIAGGLAPQSVQQAQTYRAAGTPTPGPVTGAPLTIQSGLLVWAVFAGFVVFVMWLGQRVGPTDDFRNIKVTLYNATFVGLFAVIGILLLKFFFATIKIPILSDLVVAV
jgi:hypothetical protein